MTKNLDHITTITMPDWLQCWHRENNYSFEHTDKLMRTGMADGQSLDRPAYDYAPTFIDVMIRVDSLSAAAFEAWYRDTLKNGQLWFKAKFMTPIDDHDELVVKFASIYRGPSFNKGRYSKWDIPMRMQIYDYSMWPDDWGLTPEMIFNTECFDRMMTIRQTIITEP